MEVVLPTTKRFPVTRLSTHVVVSVSSLVVVGSFVWVPAAFTWLGVKARKSKRRLAAFAAAVLILVFFPLRPWRGIRHIDLWTRWIEYFKPRVILDSGMPLDTSTPSIYTFMPHGIFPMGAAMGLVGDLNKYVFKNMNVAVADAARRVPVYRHLLGWVGDMSASQGAMTTALKQGTNVQLLAGGTAEMFLTKPTVESVVLTQRKGFVKMALQTGVPIVPVYVFGSSDTFTIVPLTDKLQWLSRLLRVSIIGLYGRGLLPVPFAVPLLYVVGAPILPNGPGGGPVPNPSQQQIDTLHGAFMAAVVKLFDKYKTVYGRGYEKKILNIV